MKKNSMQPNYGHMLNDPIVNAIDNAWQKKGQLEQFQERLGNILLQGREDTLKATVSPDDGREEAAETLRRYHASLATTGPISWISEMLSASLELVDWEHLAERLYPELKEEEEDK